MTVVSVAYYIFRGDHDEVTETIIVSGMAITFMLGFINIWALLMTFVAFYIIQSGIRQACKNRQKP
ncbi:hypothetical protein DESC_530004 [Desulfosarcina cetonica]|nr:hypothetical protein DESC_530004 [Desulfosarcina cetonica]